MLATRGGRGVILASGADEMIDLRGPFDAANLAILFGIRPEEARKFVSGLLYVHFNLACYLKFVKLSSSRFLNFFFWKR